MRAKHADRNRESVFPSSNLKQTLLAEACGLSSRCSLVEGFRDTSHSNEEPARGAGLCEGLNCGTPPWNGRAAAEDSSGLHQFGGCSIAHSGKTCAVVGNPPGSQNRGTLDLQTFENVGGLRPSARVLDRSSTRSAFRRGLGNKRGLAMSLPPCIC